MKVIDLIIKLQQMPPNKEVMLDHTTEGATMFKFVEVNEVSECRTATGEDIVLVSPFVYEENSEENDD